jgi:hypothetical protein
MAKYIPKVIPEPVWDSTKQASQFEITHALRWYHENKTDKDSRKYLLEYLFKTNRISALQKESAESLATSWHLTEGWFARILSRGANVPQKNMDFFNDKMAIFLERLNVIASSSSFKEKSKPQENVISIQDRVLEKTNFYIMELEAKFDDVWHRNSPENFVPYTWMTENGVKPMHATKIAEYFRERAKAWVLMIEARKTDEYVREAYPRTHKEYCHGANILMTFVNDAEKLASNKNAARKPRKKKPVSFEKKVSRLKYKAEDTDNKLISVNPIKIIGANQLWVYNVKTRKLGVYIAADAAGLSVKGSSIENYKYKESISKTLRKPKEILTRVLSGGKVVLRKVMDEINSKPAELNGRINGDSILLRVE